MLTAPLDVVVDGTALSLETAPGLFSPSRPDAGTLALLSHVRLSPEDKVLDLGCGYGLVGLWCAKRIGADRVTLSDVDPEAVAAARGNAVRNGLPEVRVLESDAFAGIPDAGYTLILSNPPYHADFAVAKAFIEKGFNRLALGGRMLLVTKRRDWYANKLRTVFGGVRVHETGGYFVFEAQKRSRDYAGAKPKKP